MPGELAAAAAACVVGDADQGAVGQPQLARGEQLRQSQLHRSKQRRQRPQPAVVLRLAGQLRKPARQHLPDQAEKLAIRRDPDCRLRDRQAPPARRRSSPPAGPERGTAAPSANTYAATTRVSSDADNSCSNHEGTGLETLSSSHRLVPAHPTRIRPLVGTRSRKPSHAPSSAQPRPVVAGQSRASIGAGRRPKRPVHACEAAPVGTATAISASHAALAVKPQIDLLLRVAWSQLTSIEREAAIQTRAAFPRVGPGTKRVGALHEHPRPLLGEPRKLGLGFGLEAEVPFESHRDRPHRVPGKAGERRDQVAQLDFVPADFLEDRPHLGGHVSITAVRVRAYEPRRPGKSLRRVSR